jgi:radical SAM superfamily enzyme YgiQ (UPF0313 family)
VIFQDLTPSTRHTPHILLINPWITDFAAYNFWIKPLGLLHIAALLRVNGSHVTLVDCLDFYSQKKQYGAGKFFKTWIEKPKPLKSVPRYYSQYGIPEEMLRQKLSSVEKPDLIGITSGMTYWYPGVFKIIEIVRNCLKEAPIVLGGIYATLCHEHALKYSGADYVVKGRGETQGSKLISELTSNELQTPNTDLRTNYYPAFDLYPQLGFVCITTSRGCPLRCTYCASQVLYDGFDRRDPEDVVQEIEYWVTQHKVNNIAFYDDALLVKPQDHILPILREVIKKDLRCNFHTPNGLHIREIDEGLATLVYQAGFKTIRLGFETSHETTQTETGGKVGNQEFVDAVRHLRRAGYSGDDIGAYIMVGLPGQRAEEARASIAYVQENGARPILVEYSPIPHTPLFERAKQTSHFDLESEPLYHNNSILPCQWEGFTMADYRRLKEGIRRR